MEFITYISTHGLEIANAVLVILGGFSVIAKLTPTEADNKLIDKIIGVIHAIGLTKK